MRRLMLACVLVWGWAAQASAATYYVDFATGVDTNNGTAKVTPWKHAPGMTGCTNTCASTTLVGGDSVIFKGGVTWQDSFPWTIAGGSSSMVTYTTDHTWYSGGAWAQPIFDDEGRAWHYNLATGQKFGGGYVTINDIKFYRCGTVGTMSEAGCLLFDGVHDITLSNNTFDGGTWMAVYMRFLSAGTFSNFTITGNDFTNTTSAVWIASAASGAVISNVTFTYNVAHDFASMLGCNLDPCPDGGAHGDGFLHYYNIPHEDSTQYMDGLTFCNNRTYGDFTRGLGSGTLGYYLDDQDMTGFLYLEGPVRNGLVCNNDFNWSPKQNAVDSVSIFEAIITLREYGCSTDGAMYIVNNTIRGTYGLKSGSAAILAQSTWSNITLKNNAFEFDLYCYSGESSAPSGVFDYNNRYCPELQGGWTGEGAHSISSPHQFVSATSSALQVTSPNIGAGENLTSLGFALLNADFAGTARPASGAWTIGAYVYGTAGTPPAAPTNVRIR